MPRALITGVTGQDGSHLVDLLLSEGYEVVGIKRRSSSLNTARVDHVYEDPHEVGRRFSMVYGDLSDASSLARIVRETEPDEVYNLGAQSHVQVSFETPEYTGDIDGLGAVRLLEAVRGAGLGSRTRIYQTSSSEMFGDAAESPQTERTPFRPRSPYAAAKCYAFHSAQVYREAYGMFVSNGILFNHESIVRGETFVTRKITRAAAAIRAGHQDRLYLGNLGAMRDWGYAGDFVRAMLLMLRADRPGDYVVATGEQHSVREFCSEAFACAGIPLEWRGDGLGETGISVSDGRVLVEVDARYLRPADVPSLLGDSSLIRRELLWRPTIGFKELVHLMVRADMAGDGAE